MSPKSNISEGKRLVREYEYIMWLKQVRSAYRLAMLCSALIILFGLAYLVPAIAYT